MFIQTQQALLESINKSNAQDFNSSKFLIDLSYGQIVFSTRHDMFIQAKYLPKLPFGKRRFTMFPIQGYQVVGPAPLPKEFIDHVNEYLSKYPEQHRLYQHLLKQSF